MPNFIIYLKQVKDRSKFKKGVDLVISIGEEGMKYDPSSIEQVRKMLLEIKASKEKKVSQGILVNEMKDHIHFIDDFLNK